MDLMSWAPRWIKCIPWQKKFSSFLAMQKLCAVTIYPISIGAYYGILDNPYADRLFWLKPQTDEERMQIKKNWFGNTLDRNWEIDQYEVEPPAYDTYVRRQQYPEYYGDKYNTHKRYKLIVA